MLKLMMYCMLTYTSQGQEMLHICLQPLNVIGHDIVRDNLIAEVKKARYFAVLADEVSSHNVEYLPLCLCIVILYTTKNIFQSEILLI